MNIDDKLTVPSDALVLFGVTGDLASKKIFPTLYAMVKRNRLEVQIVGVASSDWTVERLRSHVQECIAQSGQIDGQTALAGLLALFNYVSGDYMESAIFVALKKAMGNARRPAYYFAIPPGLFGTVIEGLRAACMTVDARKVIEKPLGRDLASALELDRIARWVFAEIAIFRIDHYPGKEAIMNILYLRFAGLVPATSLQTGAVVPATGSEVALCINTSEQLRAEGIKARVISMPSRELFENQMPEYREQVMPTIVGERVAVERASVFRWERYTGLTGTVIDMRSFGLSAPAVVVAKHFRFEPAHVVVAAKEQITRQMPTQA